MYSSEESKVVALWQTTLQCNNNSLSLLDDAEILQLLCGSWTIVSGQQVNPVVRGLFRVHEAKKGSVSVFLGHPLNPSICTDDSKSLKANILHIKSMFIKEIIQNHKYVNDILVNRHSSLRRRLDKDFRKKIIYETCTDPLKMSADGKKILHIGGDCRYIKTGDVVVIDFQVKPYSNSVSFGIYV